MCASECVDTRDEKILTMRDGLQNRCALMVIAIRPLESQGIIIRKSEKKKRTRKFIQRGDRVSRGVLILGQLGGD